MSTDSSKQFTKDNLDLYLNELSKEYKKLGGRKTPIEIILVGGAAIIEAYSFREMTTDIDALFPPVSIIKEAINRVEDRLNLPTGWLNADFKKTDSFSAKLAQYSVSYKTFNQVLIVRIVTGEYLIAMKLHSGRTYKNDMSDIVGILAEHEKAYNPISYEMIDTAIKNLYGGWDKFTPEAITFIQDMLREKNLPYHYTQTRKSEIEAKTALLEFQKSNPNKTDISSTEKQIKRKPKDSILAKLEHESQKTAQPENNTDDQ